MTTQKQNSMIVEILSWAGAFMILTAYLLSSLSYLGPKSIIYLLLNLFGGSFVMIDGFLHKDYQPAVLNFVWASAALYGLVTALF